MKTLTVLALVLFATKKVAEFLIAMFCILFFSYAGFVLLRDFRKPGFFRGEKSRAA